MYIVIWRDVFLFGSDIKFWNVVIFNFSEPQNLFSKISHFKSIHGLDPKKSLIIMSKIIYSDSL